MSNPWIIEPAAPGADQRINLEWIDGDVTRQLWIQVKKELSVGEQRRMLKSISSVSQPLPKVRGEQVVPEAKLEWTDYSFARMVAYIIDWSLAHEPEQANRLPPTRLSYESLRDDPFNLIDEALDAHERSVADAKKSRAGKSRPEAISA